MNDYIIAGFRTLLGTPFLLVGKFFNGLADVFIGKADSEDRADQLARRWSERIIIYLWFVIILALITIGMGS